MTTTQSSSEIVDLRDARTTEIDLASATKPPHAAPGESPRVEPGSPAGDRSDVANVFSRALTTFSALVLAMLAFLFVVSGLSEARAQTQLRRRFQADTQALRAPIGGAIPSGVPVAELDIPAIGLQQIVVQGTTSDQLRSGPGHLRQTALPGQEGNAVIFGRRSTYGGPFRHIGKLHPGDALVATTGFGKFTYVVQQVRTYQGGDGSELVGSGSNQLTLLTSDPAFFATRRLVVTADLRGRANAASVDPTPVTRAELGLSGETDAALPLILWLEVLLGAALGATWLRRYWTRWSAWVVSVPILLAAAWLVFENITRLLPATL